MNSPSHLPPLKQAELQKLTSVILQHCPDTQKIILFGSYARGNYKEEKDLLPDRRSGHVSDYDILAITSQKETALDVLLWKKISDELKKLNLSASPKILTHDIEALNIKLAEGQYFFSDVKKEGVVLFDSGRFGLMEERELTAKEKQRIARDYFEHWLKRAEMFFDDFESDFKKSENDSSYFGKSAFDLHQAAEHSYKTILLVFTNYSPQEHFLEYLAEECEIFSEELKTLFPQITEEDEDRFKLLEYAYIGGRYDPEYQIAKEDLELLAMDVKKLLEITKRECEGRIG